MFSGCVAGPCQITVFIHNINTTTMTYTIDNLFHPFIVLGEKELNSSFYSSFYIIYAVLFILKLLCALVLSS